MQVEEFIAAEERKVKIGVLFYNIQLKMMIYNF